MVFINLLNFINNTYLFSKKRICSLYLSSNLYNRKITSTIINSLEYSPNPNLLNSLIKYDKKKINIKNYFLKEIWNNQKLSNKDYKNLNSFFWLFSLDLKSSKKDTQDIILQWVKKNHQYNSRSWEVDIVAKRIIAWLSNSRLTYEDGDDNSPL